MFTVENENKKLGSIREVSFTLTVRTHLRSLFLGTKVECDCCLWLDVCMFSVAVDVQSMCHGNLVSSDLRTVLIHQADSPFISNDLDWIVLCSERFWC